MTQSPEELAGEVGESKGRGWGGAGAWDSKVHSLVRIGSLVGVFFLLKSNINSAHKGPGTPALALADARTPPLLSPPQA